MHIWKKLPSKPISQRGNEHGPVFQRAHAYSSMSIRPLRLEIHLLCDGLKIPLLWVILMEVASLEHR